MTRDSRRGSPARRQARARGGSARTGRATSPSAGSPTTRTRCRAVCASRGVREAKRQLRVAEGPRPERGLSVGEIEAPRALEATVVAERQDLGEVRVEALTPAPE